ncbi:MAG: DUF4861 domain-containing protein [Verrucomicrobiales bacterium]|nr:DUF4861 domain-containing protein [Verrucomicrobiales bacterium]
MLKKITPLTVSLLLLAQTHADADTTAQVKYIPQRADDIAWENNRVAFRIYGPKLALTEPTGSGVDVWVKSVPGMIIDKWYAGGDYHRDHGEGLDFYSVGRSRGCGGLGVWDGQRLHVSGHWSAYTIRETGLNRAVFDVEYAPWEIADGKKISEKRTITLDADSHLNRMTSRLSGDAATLTVGIGLAKGQGGELWQDRELGIVAYWQKPDAEHGIIGCAVLVDPLTVSGFAEDDLNYLILVNAKTGAAFTYYAGACWDKGANAFKTFDEWKNYLRARAVKPVDWHRTALKSATPDNEVLYLNVSGKPDVLERWWHGKRVRWLDERGTLTVGDLRGDQVFGLMQIDMDGDGFYDGPDDMNIKWCDTDGDGIPDTQAIVVNPTAWGPAKEQQTGHPVWMLFINHDNHGVLGWIDWEKFFFHCWDFTGVCNWLPNYHGNCDFVKTHAPAFAFTDARLNWENPFSFYDMTGNGVSNMAIRWCAPVPMKGAEVAIPPTLDTAFVSYDLDGNAGARNETS